MCYILLAMTKMTYQEQKQDWLIDAWLRHKGIDWTIINHHPCCQDIQLLLDFRNEFNDELATSQSMMALWGALWNISYVIGKPIKAKNWLKLEKLHERCRATRQQQEIIKARIKAMRTGTSHTQNLDHDMTAKGSNLPREKHMKWDQEGGREVLDTVPWD
jgi:hypothetical protein